MKKLLLTLALIGGAIWWCKTKCSSRDTISLENLRMGIVNGWYEVQLFVGSNGKYYAILTGKDTHGNYIQTNRFISLETYETLKAQGVPEV